MPPGLAADEAAIIDVATELSRSHSISDATYARALQQLGERGMVELTALVGYYTMVAMTLNAHEIPLPDGVAPAPYTSFQVGHPHSKPDICHVSKQCSLRLSFRFKKIPGGKSHRVFLDLRRVELLASAMRMQRSTS